MILGKIYLPGEGPFELTREHKIINLFRLRETYLPQQNIPDAVMQLRRSVVLLEQRGLSG